MGVRYYNADRLLPGDNIGGGFIVADCVGQGPIVLVTSTTGKERRYSRTEQVLVTR